MKKRKKLPPIPDLYNVISSYVYGTSLASVARIDTGLRAHQAAFFQPKADGVDSAAVVKSDVAVPRLP